MGKRQLAWVGSGAPASGGASANAVGASNGAAAGMAGASADGSSTAAGAGAVAPGALWLMLAGLAVMAVPTLWDLAGSVWVSEEQGHGPVILAVSLWLIHQKRRQLAAAPTQPCWITGSALVVAAALCYLIGRSQATLQLEVLAPLLGGVGVLLLHRGQAALRVVALPVLCLLFVVPLPGTLVQTITIPLKIGVSHVAETLLHAANYPIARTGVILAIDRYQLLVADACAGLTSMFTLEAMGLLYLNMRNYASRLHNVLLAVLLVPIAFVANVIRVIVLVLVTYHFGDAVGRGFVHSAAGVLLFVVAMLLMLAVDALISRAIPAGKPMARERPNAASGPQPGARRGFAGAWLVAAGVALLLAVPVPAAEWLRPVHRSSDLKGPVDLATQVPRQMGDWQEDLSVRPVMPDPALQATLDQTYSQVLARTYVNAAGQRVMLSVAYGNDQSSKATAVHAPEFCYRSQGFEVMDGGQQALSLAGHRVRVQRLLAQLGPRVEPITYWVTLDEEATLPGWPRKLQQLRLGLGGVIADGMVVRVSTLGADREAGYALQARFLSQWFAAVPADVRKRYFGAPAAAVGTPAAGG